MPKRFTATELWNEDWFLDMPMEYKLFWYYMLSKCDHAGLFRVNLKGFCVMNGAKLTSKKVLEYFNTDKQRIREVSDRVWLIEDFFSFQYGNKINESNRVHESVIEVYKKNAIPLESISGIVEVKHGIKDKDKDSINNTIVKQKTNGNKFSGNFKARGEELFAHRATEGQDKDE